MNTPGAQLYTADGAIFCVLDVLHAVTLPMALRRPRRLVPGGPAQAFSCLAISACAPFKLSRPRQKVRSARCACRSNRSSRCRRP